MDKDIAIAKLAECAGDMRRRGVIAAYLFGSTVNGLSTSASDLDVFIEVAADRKFSLLDLAAMQRLLEAELGVKVDLTTRGSLHQRLRAEIEQNAVRVF